MWHWVPIALGVLIAAVMYWQMQLAQKAEQEAKKALKEKEGHFNDLESALSREKTTIQKLKNELGEAQSKLKEAKQQASKIRKNAEQTVARIEEIRSEEPALEREVLDLREAHAILLGQVDDLKRQRSEAETLAQKQIQQAKEQTQKQVSDLQAEVERLKEETQAEKRKAKKLEGELGKEKKRIGAEVGLLKRMTARVENIDKAFQVAQQEIKRSHRQILELTNQLSAERKLVANLSPTKSPSLASADPSSEKSPATN